MDDQRHQQLRILADMEVRQDDLLRRLDELDQRIKRVLTECLAPAQQAEPPLQDGIARAA